MRNGEWGMVNGKLGMRNSEREKGNRKWEIE